jgi:hypothetical protein
MPALTFPAEGKRQIARHLRREAGLGDIEKGSISKSITIFTCTFLVTIHISNRFPDKV